MVHLEVGGKMYDLLPMNCLPLWTFVAMSQCSNDVERVLLAFEIASNGNKELTEALGQMYPDQVKELVFEWDIATWLHTEVPDGFPIE